MQLFRLRSLYLYGKRNELVEGKIRNKVEDKKSYLWKEVKELTRQSTRGFRPQKVETFFAN